MASVRSIGVARAHSKDEHQLSAAKVNAQAAGPGMVAELKVLFDAFEKGLLSSEQFEHAKELCLSGAERQLTHPAEYLSTHASSRELSEALAAVAGRGIEQEEADKARAAFEMHDLDRDGSIDRDEWPLLLRWMRIDTTDENEAEQLFHRADTIGNGTLCLDEFLVIWAELQESRGEVNGYSGPSSVSYYGVPAMMRWIKHSPFNVGGDVTGQLVPLHVRTARKLVLSPEVEFTFYACIATSAVVAGLQTNPDIEVSLAHNYRCKLRENVTDFDRDRVLYSYRNWAWSSLLDT